MINSNRIFQFCIISIYILVFIVISQNLKHEYLWFDESVQFWVAKGLNPDSEPLALPGNAMDVIENNKYYNMDPGGFSLLLHFWSMMSNDVVWLRLLPFIFFIGIVVAFIYLSYHWLKNLNVALLIGFIPILYPMFLNMGFEIRAFTMEAFGTILCVISLERLGRKISLSRLFFWGVIFSVFLTSRYSAIFVIYITGLFIAYLILRQRESFGTKLLSLSVYGSPILITTIYIYFSAFRYQNPGASPVTYIQYLSDAPQLLFKPQALIYLCFVGFLIFIYFVRNRYEVIKKYKSLLLLAIVVNGLFLLLSLAGKYPWLPPFTFRSNRCISMILLTAICYSSLLGELLVPLFRSKDVIKYYVMVSTLIFILSQSFDNLFIRFTKWDPKIRIKESESNKYVSDNVYLDIINSNLIETNKILVYVGETPYIKYLYEYGALVSGRDKIYPHRFTMTKSGRHTAFEGAKDAKLFGSRAINPQIGEFSDYDIIISDNIPEENKWIRIDKASYLWVKK